jgi:hypothetical protein
MGDRLLLPVTKTIPTIDNPDYMHYIKITWVHLGGSQSQQTWGASPVRKAGLFYIMSTVFQ